MNVYMTKPEIMLTLEAFGMLTTDYPDGHPEAERLAKIVEKLHYKMTQKERVH